MDEVDESNASFRIDYRQEIVWTASYTDSGLDPGNPGNDFIVLRNGLEIDPFHENLIRNGGIFNGAVILDPGNYSIKIRDARMGEGIYAVYYNRSASCNIRRVRPRGGSAPFNFGNHLTGEISDAQEFEIDINGDPLPINGYQLGVEVTGIQSSDPTHFRVTPNGNQSEFDVVYQAGNTVGTFNATITVGCRVTSGNNFPAIPDVMTQVTGTTEERIPDIDCAGGNCNNANIRLTVDGTVGESGNFNVRVENDGTEELDIAQIRLGNGSHNSFTLQGNANQIPAGGNVNIRIDFNPPPEENVYCGSLEIVSNDPDEPVKSCFFRARSYHPVPIMVVEPLVLEYREVELGFSFRKAFTVSNMGDATLDFAVNYVDDTNPDNFQWAMIVTGNFSIPANGAPITFFGEYTPQEIGNHSMGIRVSGNDPSNPSDDITLNGTGITPIPIDNVLILDRSGSMQDQIGSRTKIAAMRTAANLYFDLLRRDEGSRQGDKIGLVKYNDNNEVYAPLDFKTVGNSGSHTEVIKTALESNSITDPNRLLPYGRTGIGGAMETASNLLVNSPEDRKQVMIVMTDGIENEDPRIEAVLPEIIQANPDLMIYSIGLGRDQDIERRKLQNITNVGNGFYQVANDLVDENMFALEEFYFKIYSNANGMDLVIDPTIPVHILDPSPRVLFRTGIVSSYKSAVFMVLDDPQLRSFYDLELIDPQNRVINLNTPVGGTPVQVAQKDNYKIYKVVFPDQANAENYVGDWVLQLTPNGRFDPKKIDTTFADYLHPANQAQGAFIIPHDGVIPVGFSAAVKSNYNLRANLTSPNYRPNNPITASISLTDRGWPSTGGNVNARVTLPNDAEDNVTLYDDGTHGDSEANDGIYTHLYQRTNLSGVYKFHFKATGINERGELVPREASRYINLDYPESDHPTPGDDDDCLTCKQKKIFFYLTLVLLLIILVIIIRLRSRP